MAPAAVTMSRGALGVMPFGVSASSVPPGRETWALPFSHHRSAHDGTATLSGWYEYGSLL